MGRLSTALNLPKQIFLKDWGATEFLIDPNILLSFTFILEPTPLDGSIITYSSVYSPSYPAPQKIYFWGSYWELRDILDNSAQWFNNSSSTILPLTGWERDNAQGPAGTITPILTNTKNISIKKQNLGGGRLLAPKLNQSITMILIIGGNTLNNVFFITVEVGTVIRFVSSSSSGLQTTITWLTGGGAYPNGALTAHLGYQDIIFTQAGSYSITANQGGNAVYKPARRVTVLVTANNPSPPPSSGSSGFGVGGGGV